jgi:hypothetical protein
MRRPLRRVALFCAGLGLCLSAAARLPPEIYAALGTTPPAAELQN